jgi:hypothetical protein
MRLVRRLIELAFVIFVLSLFMKNKDVVMQITYYGLSAPITVAFWELVTVCVSLGIIVSAVGDFITQFKWAAERRQMIKRDSEHRQVVDGLNQRIEQLESDNKALKAELEKAEKERPWPTTVSVERPSSPVSATPAPFAVRDATATGGLDAEKSHEAPATMEKS